MTTLVTGGAGYIGSHMAWHLVDRGRDVVVVDDLSTGRDWLVPGHARLEQGDVGDRAFMEAVIRRHGVREIVHFAGSIVVPESVSDPLGYYRNNTVASHALISAAVATGVERFVFSSTAAVYGTPAQIPVGEDAPLAPESPYGWSKLMTERMLQDAHAAHGLRVGILRYFNVAGADAEGRAGQATPEATHLIKVAVQAATGQRDGVSIYGTDYPTPDGTGVRDYIHVSDLIDAHALALDHLEDHGLLVANCGYGRGFSVREVLKAVSRVSGTELRITEAARRAGDPSQIVADNSRIRENLGWTPRRDDIDTIVSDALRWERHLAVRNDQTS